MSTLSIVDKLRSIMAPGNGFSGRPAASPAPADPPVDRSVPTGSARYVVIDTELTGLKVRKDSIVSIGAVVMQGGRIEIGNNFYRVVEPRTALTGSSIVIHGITPSETAERPTIDRVLPEFLEFCSGSVVVGHVVSIDLQFLNREMKELYGMTIQNRVVDTYRLYQWISGKEDNRCAYHGGSPECADLFSLAQRYKIPVQGAHNALGDAFITAQLFQRLLRELPRWNVTTLDGLLRIAGP